MGKDDLLDVDSGVSRRRSLLWQRKGRPSSKSPADTASAHDSDSQSIVTRASSDNDDALGSSVTTGVSFNSRDKEFHNHFKTVPFDEHLLQDFKCALQKDVQLQGRLYVSQRYVCFKSNILGYVTNLVLQVQDIKSIERVRTIRWMPRVVQITMNNDEKYVFTSFLASISSRDDAFFRLQDVWQQMFPPTPPTSAAAHDVANSSQLLSLPTSGHEAGDLHVLPNHLETSTSATTSSAPRGIFTRRRAQTVGNQDNHVRIARDGAPRSNSTDIPVSSSKVVAAAPRIVHEVASELATSSGSSQEVVEAMASSSTMRRRASERRKAASAATNNDHQGGASPKSHLLVFATVVLVVSHIILALRFYSMSREVQQFQDQDQDAAEALWVAQLQNVKDQAQHWKAESLRQRRQLLNMVPN